MLRIDCIALCATALSLAPSVHADDPIGNPYQQAGFNPGCTSPGACQLTFPAVASETVVLHASCEFTLKTKGVSAGLGISGVNGFNELQVFATDRSEGYTNYQINAATYLFYSPGQQPYIEVFAVNAPVTDLTCTISGYSAHS